MPEPLEEGAVKSREYLHPPEFGTSFDGLDVGGSGAPEIKSEWVLNIYVR